MKQPITTLKHYPGNKGSSAAYPTIMNHVPEHMIYYELFAGSAQIAHHIIRSYSQFTPNITLNELNPLAFELLKTEFPEDVVISNDNAIHQMKVLSQCTFAMSECFVYLDPPYVLSSRRSGLELYSFEMTDDDHVQLLNECLKSKCLIMISGYANDIYDEMLHSWCRYEFTVQTRRGLATEVIWMNYNINDHQLHTYDYIGTDRTDRQRLNRKHNRFMNKIKNLPRREQEKLFAQLKRTYEGLH